MALRVSYWERRDVADRDSLGHAALAYCRALRATEGLRDVRYYWQSPDTVVVVEEVESLDGLRASLSSALTSTQAQALFALSDLARQTRREQWQDAASGEDLYQRAATCYHGPAEVELPEGHGRERVQADLWSLGEGQERAWGGELRALAAWPIAEAVVERGAELVLALPSGAYSHCQVSKIRTDRPPRLRVDGIGQVPFG